jgi:hypothetical protein
MRVWILAILFAFSLSGTASAQAIPYDNFPICLKVYGPVSYSECRYTSIAQCQPSASGRSAQCLENPFYVSSFTARGKRQR